VSPNPNRKGLYGKEEEASRSARGIPHLLCVREDPVRGRIEEVQGLSFLDTRCLLHGDGCLSHLCCSTN